MTQKSLSESLREQRENLLDELACLEMSADRISGEECHDEIDRKAEEILERVTNILLILGITHEEFDRVKDDTR